MQQNFYIQKLWNYDAAKITWFTVCSIGSNKAQVSQYGSGPLMLEVGNSTQAKQLIRTLALQDKQESWAELLIDWVARWCSEVCKWVAISTW